MTINEMKQSYKQSYTDNVELSIFNCGHEYCQPGHTWGPGVRDHYLIHLVVAGKALMTGYLYIFMAHLMKEAREAMPNVGSSSSQYVLAAIKYIQFNYSHDISVDDIAKAVGVSRSHLYRVFMSNVGQSPIDYLTSYRISEACSLLKNSSLSIAEIAVSVGFFDQFYFSRVFKKVKGVPPSKYLATLEKEGPAAPQAINP